MEPRLRPSDQDSAADGQLKGVALAVRKDGETFAEL